MNEPTLARPVAAASRRPAPIDVHLLGCGCDICDPVPPALPIAKLTIAGIVIAHLIVFAIDGRGAVDSVLSILTIGAYHG